MKRIALFLLFAVVAVSTGCRTIVPFRHAMRSEYKLSNKDLKDLHFYLTAPLALRSDKVHRAASVTPKHNLVLVDGKEVEQVLITTHTSGVAEQATDDSILVSFEKGAAIVFRSDPTTRKDNKGRYKLVLGEDENGKRSVFYKGKTYRVVYGSRSCNLAVDLREIKRVKRTTHVPEGRTLEVVKKPKKTEFKPAKPKK